MDLGEEYHRGHVPFSHHIMRIDTISVSTGDVNLGHLAMVTYGSFHHWKRIILPFPSVRIGVTEVQPTAPGERNSAVPPRGRNLKNLWIYVHVQITRAINKYLGEIL